MFVKEDIEKKGMFQRKKSKNMW